MRHGTGPPRLAACEYRAVDAPSQLASTVEAAVQDHGLEGATCVVVLSPEQYSLHLLDAPEVERSERGGAARWLVKDLLDFPVDEAVIDLFEVPQPHASGRPDRVYVVAARASVVQGVVDIVRQSGLELEAIDITELAVRNLTALLPEDEHGVALLQLGPRHGLITMTQTGSLFLARRLEAGLEQLAGVESVSANDLGLQLDHEAETFDVLLLEVQRLLDYYESQLGPAPVANLLVAPLEWEQPELLPHLEKNLTINVGTLDLNGLFECSQPLPMPLQARCLAALGAGLRLEPNRP